VIQAFLTVPKLKSGVPSSKKRKIPTNTKKITVRIVAPTAGKFPEQPRRFGLLRRLRASVDETENI
jgi:hypothetical protein